MADIWKERKKSLEKEYFQRKEQEALEKTRQRLAAAEREHDKEASFLHCPKCGEKLEEILFRGIRVERCTGGHGVWLDAGEVEHLTTRESQGWLSLFGTVSAAERRNNKMKHALSLSAEARQRTGTGSAKKKAATGRTDLTVIRRRPRGVTPALAPSESDALHGEMLIPEQFFTLAHHSAARWSGARRLILAVLQDAVTCWFRHRHAQTARGRRLFRETHAWFWAKDRDWLFAFECVCAHLKLDPDYIRYGLTRWQTSQPSRQTPSIRVEPVFLPGHLSLVHS